MFKYCAGAGTCFFYSDLLYPKLAGSLVILLPKCPFVSSSHCKVKALTLLHLVTKYLMPDFL